MEGSGGCSVKEIIRHTGHFNILYSDYVEITGDACAAQLLSSLEYWTKCKLYVVEEVERQNAEAAKNNAPLLPVPELWLYEKIQDFVDSICGTFKRNKVLEALKLLKEKGFVESKPSPNPWDKTCFWRMNIKKIQDALDSNQAKGFEPEKTKSPRVQIQTLDSLDSNLESLDSDLESLDSNLVESLNSNSHPYIIQDPNIQSKNSIKDPPTPQGGTGLLSQEGENLTGEEDRNRKIVEPPQDLKQDSPEQIKSSSEDQTSPAPTPIFSVHKKEHQDRIVAIYQSNKPIAWQPVNNLHRAIRVMVDGLLSSEDFRGDLEAFLTRLENALLELNDPTSKFSWFRSQGNLGITTLLSNYGKHLMEFSDAWTERQKPQTQAKTLPDWALEAQREIEARQLKKAG